MIGVSVKGVGVSEEVRNDAPHIGQTLLKNFGSEAKPRGKALKFGEQLHNGTSLSNRLDAQKNTSSPRKAGRRRVKPQTGAAQL
jgi:hypothetical protein